ncbi:MAG: MopE-related protein, partial [Myxococcota bacterium]|nr:MopE-related protein [Myxococcota bacterium]
LEGSCAACAETPYEICVDGAERESCREEAELETEERCDAIDEDCDGFIDETFTEQGVSCVIPGGIGRCANGQWRCDTGRLRCQGESPLAAETCNEIDDDCDGVVDEELAAIDDCDGVDNDCDGRVDEDFAPEAIDCRFGIACSLPGESRCVDGAFIEECPDDPRQPEICDGIDNNCDDSIDEGLVRMNENQEGVCAGREDNCIEGEWISRTIPDYEDREQSCDRLDNDCDGRTDESISRLAENQTGVCEGIEERCNNGDWSTEYPDTYERVESRCDGLDNDCDGRIDRNLSRLTANQQGVCVGRQELCQGGRWVLGAQPNYEEDEQSCDNRDNDCDGRTDESLTRPLAGAVGVCAGAIERCVAGVWRVEGREAFEEVELSCDNLDNDCDGFIDENINRISQRPGVCRGLSERCVQGVWGYPPAPDFEAPESSCDDQDNDCDGETDEGLNCAPPPVPCSLDPDRADCVATAVAGCRAGIYWLRGEDDGNPGNANLIYGPAALNSFNPVVHRDRESPEGGDLIAPAFSCAAVDEEDAEWGSWLEVNCHAALAWGNAANNTPAANCAWTPGIPGGTSNNICVASTHNAAPSWIRIDRELRRRPLGLAVVCDGIPAPDRTLLEERLTPTLGRDSSRSENGDGDCLPVDSPEITFARCGQARYQCSTRNARGYATFSAHNPEGPRRDCVRFSISSPSDP